MNDNTKNALSATNKALVYCGAIACPLFILVVLIEGATRTNYNSFRYPLSSLAIGDLGWIQMANFIITGLVLFLFSIGLKRVSNFPGGKFYGALLIKLVGIGLMGAGIFSTDPIYGYPSGKPLLLAQFTVHGHLHDAFSMLVFVCLPWACFVFRKRFIRTGEQAWAKYSAFTGASMIIVFILTAVGFKQITGFVDFAGILQRLCIIIGWTWITLLSLHLVRFKYL